MQRVGASVVGLMVCLSVVLALPGGANAKKSRDVSYRFEQVWSATMRLVRVDYRFPVQDKDEGVGYVLFEYKQGDRSYPGSFELVRRSEGRREAVHVVLTIPAMPSYIETMMLEKLEKKLEKEFGAPLPPPKDEGPTDPGDKGDEDDRAGEGGG